VRGIPIRLEIDYTRKARGRVSAECRCTLPDITEPVDHVASADLRDRTGEQVAAISVTWRLSPFIPGSH
jgi:hypothetical protein